MKKIGSMENYVKACSVLEIFVSTYVAITALINFFNVCGIMKFSSLMMKPSFLGGSLLLVFLFQINVGSIVNESDFLVKLRPFFTGIVLAEILFVGNMSLVLMFAALLGYLVYEKWERRCSLREMLRILLIAAVVTEVLSFFLMYNRKCCSVGILKDFSQSPVLDIILVGLIVLYILVVRFDVNVIPLKRKWISTKALGLTLCFVSLVIHLFLSIVPNIANAMLVNPKEEVYTIRDAVNPSLVLTELYHGKSRLNTVSFQRNVGKNNQKVKIENVGHGIFKFYFLKSGNAMASKISEKDGSVILCAEPSSEEFGQYWKMGPSVGGVNGYVLLSADGFWMTYDYGYAVGKVPTFIRGLAGNCTFYIIEKTSSNQFLTSMDRRFYEEFKPTSFFEGLSYYVGAWIFLVIFVVFAVILFLACRNQIISVKVAILCGVMSAYLLVYGAVSLMIVAFAIFAFVCDYGYCKKMLVCE